MYCYLDAGDRMNKTRHWVSLSGEEDRQKSDHDKNKIWDRIASFSSVCILGHSSLINKL